MNIYIYILPTQDLALDSNEGLGLQFSQLALFGSLESLGLSNTGILSLEGISGAKNLKHLFAVGNRGLNGTLPEELFSMSKLEKVYLADSNLSGDLSPALFLLSNLEVLNLDRNKFHGQIPSAVGSMPNLRELVLSLNYLTGTLPSEISSLAKLEKIDVRHQLGSKPIEGRLPDFANATRLHYIDLSNNALSHELPRNLLLLSQRLHSEIIINLDNNEISGAIPLTLQRFSKLDLRLANNMIEDVPHEFCTLTGWYVLIPPVFWYDVFAELTILHKLNAGPTEWWLQSEVVMLFFAL